MNPTKGKILLKAIQEKKSPIILVNEEKNNKIFIKDYIIEKVGKDCDSDFKQGQKVTMREHHYKIPVILNKDDAKNGIYYFLIDQSEIWGIE